MLSFSNFTKESIKRDRNLFRNRPRLSESHQQHCCSSFVGEKGSLSEANDTDQQNHMINNHYCVKKNKKIRPLGSRAEREKEEEEMKRQK